MLPQRATNLSTVSYLNGVVLTVKLTLGPHSSSSTATSLIVTDQCHGKSQHNTTWSRPLGPRPAHEELPRRSVLRPPQPMPHASATRAHVRAVQLTPLERSKHRALGKSRNQTHPWARHLLFGTPSVRRMRLAGIRLRRLKPNADTQTGKVSPDQQDELIEVS